MTDAWVVPIILLGVGLSVGLVVLATARSLMVWGQRAMRAPWLLGLGSFPLLRFVACLLLGFVAGLLMESLLWGVSLALLGLLASRTHTQIQIRKRLRQIERQIPEFCDAVAGALRSGATLRSAVAQARDQLSLPIRSEIDRLLNLLRLGLSQEEALSRWADKSGLAAVRDLAFCAGVSSRSGGSLAPLVETIGENLTSQLALQDKADALTSQGRLQAIVMVGIPPALLAMTGLMDPSVWSFFFHSTLGTTLLWTVLTLELIGLFWIRKITQVRRSN